MPESTLITTSADGLLLCPLCGGDYVHVDAALIAGRAREDGTVKPVRVDAAGDVRTGDVTVPVKSSRRHSIGVQGRCELCGGEFVIEFSQHKGQTEVRVLRQQWEPVATTQS